MPTIQESGLIKNVLLVSLRRFTDERGTFIETFRKEWFPNRTWERVQCNRSESQRGVLRGLHYHKNQVDYWYVTQGDIRVWLVDLRPDSPTYQATQMLEMDGDDTLGLFIPTGVAHGFVALSDCVLTYVVDNYYDSHDEFGLAWDDPQFNLDWGIDEPIVSGRDRKNPRLSEIPDENLVRLY